jgi:hypothetical protein
MALAAKFRINRGSPGEKGNESSREPLLQIHGTQAPPVMIPPSRKEDLRDAASATKAIVARGQMPLRLVSNRPQGNDFSKPPTHQADTATQSRSSAQSIRMS